MEGVFLGGDALSPSVPVGGHPKNCRQVTRLRYWAQGCMRRDVKKAWVVRGMAAALLALTFGYVPYHLYSRSGFSRYLELRAELHSIQHEIARMRLENVQLEREAAALRSDPRMIEREARTRLMWVKPGEVIFDLGERP
jgi:cell division protein FtsB